jgi:RNA polymerase sigma-70 factor (ECF subfamily)
MRHEESPTTSTAQSRDALERLVDNRRQFLAFLQRRLGDPQAAEELLQAAYLRGVEHVGELRQGESALAWFYRLLRNALVDHWRQQGSERRGVERLARELGDARIPAPEVETELCRCFESQLVDLPDGYAEILQRVDLQGQRPVDYAADHGITANNAMVRLHRARRALRDRLLHLCGACAEHGCLDCGCHTAAADCKGDEGHPSA